MIRTMHWQKQEWNAFSIDEIKKYEIMSTTKLSKETNLCLMCATSVQITMLLLKKLQHNRTFGRK